ncbi:hypothetical protein [Nocardioides sp. GXZ039]|uniref:hypothetical protein n=1 Tax=Nocardioides sp. GXZ039 TaxID=3136018 RepID=UPI0030F4A10C
MDRARRAPGPASVVGVLPGAPVVGVVVGPADRLADRQVYWFGCDADPRSDLAPASGAAVALNHADAGDVSPSVRHG